MPLEKNFRVHKNETITLYFPALWEFALIAMEFMAFNKIQVHTKYTHFITGEPLVLIYYSYMTQMQYENLRSKIRTLPEIKDII